MSRGPELGSIATWIVWARSWAEIPVLTPPAASIVTVKAVCSGASFFAAIRFRPSFSQRSAVSARQISPRASLAMKLTASGVANWAAITRSPSFSRSSPSQTTTIRPRRISSIASSIVANGLSAAVPPAAPALWFSSVCSGHRAPSSLANGATKRSTYLATRSTSTFSSSPAARRAEVRPLQGLGDQRDLDPLRRPSVGDGEADAAERDRALVDRVADEPRGRGRRGGGGRSRPRRSRRPCRRRRRGPGRCGRRGAGGPHRQLEVDPVAGGEAAERGDREGLVHRLGLEAAGVGGDRGQADAVDGDRVAEADLRRPSPVSIRSRAPSPPLSSTRPCRRPGSAR